MKTLSIELTPGLRDLFDEVSKKGNAFYPESKASKDSLTCGALTLYCLIMLKRHISDSQYQAYTNQADNEEIFNLAAAYLRAKRGLKGYGINLRGIVIGPNL